MAGFIGEELWMEEFGPAKANKTREWIKRSIIITKILCVSRLFWSETY